MGAVPGEFGGTPCSSEITSPSRAPNDIIPFTEDRCASNCPAQAGKAVARRASRLFLPEHSEAKCTVNFGIWYKCPRSDEMPLPMHDDYSLNERPPLSRHH
jgi:hypothetical protein